MTRRTERNGFTPGRQATGTGAGRLVLVVGALSALDLLLAAARRRMPASSFEFPVRITTRRNGVRDAEVPVTRNDFRAMEHDGGFVATWEAGGHRFGLPSHLRDLLADGHTAVIAAPADAVADLREVCTDFRIVRLADQLDAARLPLTLVRRMPGPRPAVGLETPKPAPRTDAVSFAGGWSSAVRALSEALLRIEAERAYDWRELAAVQPGARGAPGSVRRLAPSRTGVTAIPGRRCSGARDRVAAHLDVRRPRTS